MNRTASLLSQIANFRYCLLIFRLVFLIIIVPFYVSIIEQKVTLTLTLECFKSFVEMHKIFIV